VSVTYSQATRGTGTRVGGQRRCRR